MKAQVDFGPRVPNTKAHAECGNYLADQLAAFGAQVTNQYADLPAYNGTLLKAADLLGSIDSLKAARESVHNRRSLAAIERLEAIYQVLKLYGVEEYVSFDLGMLSKYHYYTGIIFKAYTYGVGAPIVKGGRYDTLLRQFGKDAPAIGFAMVADDVLEAVQYQKAPLPQGREKRVLTYTAEDYAEKLQEARMSRLRGIPTMLVRQCPE